MHTHSIPWIVRVVLAATLVLTAPGPGAAAAADGTADAATATGATGATVFVGANVVPMDAERVLEDHTVVVENGRITAIEPRDAVAIPPGVVVIDAAGDYLVPGLADMHTHLSGEAPFVEGEAQLPYYLAEGVTTIRLLSATPGGLELRDEIARGERVGPTIYSSGHTVVGMPEFLFLERYKLAAMVAVVFVVGLGLCWLVIWLALRGRRQVTWAKLARLRWPSLAVAAVVGVVLVMTRVIPINPLLSRTYPWVHVVESPEDAREVVRSQARAGYDLVKVYDYLTEETALAVLDEARQQGLYTVGHLAGDVPVETLLDGGLREIAHVDELMERHRVGETGVHGGFAPVPLDHSTIPRTVELIASHDVFVVSNLVADEVSFEALDDPAGWLQRPEYGLLPESTRERWLSEGRFVNWQGQQAWRRDTLQPFLQAMIAGLHDGGVKFLVGTDVSVEGIMPGHIHRDLELLVESGLTPYQALEAGTRNAGLSVARMGGDGSFGTIEVGKRADLMLLEGNPLDEISATRDRVGVMVQGRWFTQSSLNDRLGSLAAR